MTEDQKTIEALLSQVSQLMEESQQQADSAALWQERAIHYMNGEAQAVLTNKKLERQLAALQGEKNARDEP